MTLCQYNISLSLSLYKNYQIIRGSILSCLQKLPVYDHSMLIHLLRGMNRVTLSYIFTLGTIRPDDSGAVF